MIFVGTARSRRLALFITLAAIALVAGIVAVAVGGFLWSQWHRASAARSLATRFEHVIDRQNEASKLLVGSDRQREVDHFFVAAPNPPAAAASLQQQISSLSAFRTLTIQDLSAAPREGASDEIAVTLSATGNLLDVTQFITELNSLAPHLFIESLAMSRARLADTTPAQAQISIRLFGLFLKESKS